MRILLFFMTLMTLLTPTLLAEHDTDKPAMIFASANLKFVFPRLIQDFYLKYPDSRILVQYGASGDLTRSIISGSYYDLFFSANEKYPAKVYKAKKSITKPKTYTKGSLILLAPPTAGLKERGINILQDKNITAIVLANAQSAPYGQASIEALKNMHFYKNLKNKIHYSTDIATAVDRVIWYDEIGFISKSALSSLPKEYQVEGVTWIEIEQKYYTPLTQAFVVSKGGLKNSSAIKFSNYILSKEGQKIFKFYGYKKIE